MGNGPPIGIIVWRYCCGRRFKNISKDVGYRVFILVFTFFCYTCFHLSRKPLSVVKNVLHQNCSGIKPPPGVDVKNNATWCDWAPFNQENGDELLGTLDSAFLFSYAIAMFFSGPIAERVNLRYFLSLGMIFSGITTYLIGVAYTYNIHQLWYFIIVQIIGGVVQSTGWPSVVTCVGNWFGKGRRGLIFGIWNSHTSVGNILGSLISGAFVINNWGYSFIIPGAIIGVAGLLVFLFLVVDPEEVDCVPADHHGERSASANVQRRNPSINRKKEHASNDEEDYIYGLPDMTNSRINSGYISSSDSSPSPPGQKYSYAYVHESDIKSTDDEKPLLPVDSMESTRSDQLRAITFTGALKIPGVIEFALCLFFAKLVSYTFLYWLPKYIKVSTSLTASEAAILSTLFDLGGIIGGIVAGVISDHTAASATTCTTMLVMAVPMLFVYEEYAHVSLAWNIILLMLCGLLVNGPYALITTAVSAELGTHRSLKGNSRALATVTSIIDGTGSMGAAVGPLLAGVLSANTGWTNVFYMLMTADVVAVLLLVCLVKREVRRLLLQWFDKRHHHQIA